MIMGGEILLEGNWKLETNTKMFITQDDEGTKKYKILSLSTSELKLEIISGPDKMQMILKKSV